VLRRALGGVPSTATYSGWKPTPVIDCAAPVLVYWPSFSAFVFALTAVQSEVLPTEFTRELLPTVKPSALSDWM
jgi:hypothetical protein